MPGNVWTWCQESSWQYPAGSKDRAVKDEDDKRDITTSLRRVLRGASFVFHPSSVRASFRSLHAPADRTFPVGLRVARTLP
jgi:formylglycine-generating enzyme required for sulfatase activity